VADKQQQQQQKQETFTIISLDESFFFYDSLVRRVWIEQKKRPIVRVTGSHKHSCIFGAISMKGKKQLFIDSTIGLMAIHFYLF
jgi:filamentous hemagglutinin family protein